MEIIIFIGLIYLESVRDPLPGFYVQFYDAIAWAVYFLTRTFLTIFEPQIRR